MRPAFVQRAAWGSVIRERCWVRGRTKESRLSRSLFLARHKRTDSHTWEERLYPRPRCIIKEPSGPSLALSSFFLFFLLSPLAASSLSLSPSRARSFSASFTRSRPFLMLLPTFFSWLGCSFFDLFCALSWSSHPFAPFPLVSPSTRSYCLLSFFFICPFYLLALFSELLFYCSPSVYLPASLSLYALSLSLSIPHFYLFALPISLSLSFTSSEFLYLFSYFFSLGSLLALFYLKSFFAGSLSFSSSLYISSLLFFCIYIFTFFSTRWTRRFSQLAISLMCILLSLLLYIQSFSYLVFVLIVFFLFHFFYLLCTLFLKTFIDFFKSSFVIKNRVIDKKLLLNAFQSLVWNSFILFSIFCDITLLWTQISVSGLNIPENALLIPHTLGKKEREGDSVSRIYLCAEKHK